jgi:hypothetical protein
MGWDRQFHQTTAVTASTTPEARDDLPPHYFDLYKLAVDMTDRISTRRVVANSFFATVHTGLIALRGNQEFPWHVAFAGVVLSLVWWALLKSYRDLNAAKFKVICKMEERLPAKIFGDEWAVLKQAAPPSTLRFARMRGWLAQYRELGQVERIVPWMFAVIYLIDLASRIWS